MNAHSIDKQVFELNCSSESMAAGLQKQLLYYTMPAFESIIGEIMDELAAEHEFYRIDRLEIDLGEWTGAVFGQTAMLNTFREVCKRRMTESLRGCGNGTMVSPYGPGDKRVVSQHGFGKRSDSVMQSTADTEWEIARVFLLTGDLPWWTDKSLLPDMDVLLKRAIHRVPDQVKSFLEQQSGSSVVFRRLRHQYRKDTLQVLDRLHLVSLPAAPGADPDAAAAGADLPRNLRSARLPPALRQRTSQGGVPNISSDTPVPFGSSGPFVPFDLPGYIGRAHARPLPERSLLERSLPERPLPAAALHRRRTMDGREHRRRILDKLVKGKSTGWLASLKLLDVLTAETFGRLESIVLDQFCQNKPYDREVRKILRRLTDFQLAFLLRTLNGPVNKSSADSSASERLPMVLTLASKLKANNDKPACKMPRRLETPPTALQEALLQWPEKQLLSLLKKAERMAATAKELKEIGRALAERPTLLALLLLHLPAGFGGLDPSLAFAGKKVFPKKTDCLFGWNAGEESVLEDILQRSGAITSKASTASDGVITSGERKVLTRCLEKLSAPAMLLLHRFTDLPEEKMKELLSSVSPITTMEEKERDGEESQRILVENAGLCLFAPYLPPFFRNLGYTDGKQFKDIRYACKAIYLLQYIATGKRKAPEYLLAFNKLLCGLLPGTAIPGPVRLTKKELAEADNLAEAVISNWPALKNTSVDGLRGSFLCRKGIFRDTGSRRVLQVERKEYDLLLNGLGWSYSLLKLPWMKKHIEIEW
jgi:Contractile injection system tape measure protein